MKDQKNSKIRTPIVEGILYPSNLDDLKTMLEGFHNDKPQGNDPIIVSPHGSYEFVGQQIYDAFKASMAKEIKEVVIISSVHREECDNIILPQTSSFQTIAGKLEINMKSLFQFKGEDPYIIRNEIPHMEEHSIEDQLPFISLLLGEVKILPILVGKTTISLIKKLKKGLERAYGNNPEKVLFVISSNLSDYDSKERALEQSDKALELFEKGDWRDLCEKKRENIIQACGAGPLAALLALYDKQLKMKIHSRSNPQGIGSENDKIVSYGAISFGEG